ncbi:S49 family peptidase [Limnovirga soli]|nr:S49 family peptidase [Limnovirga soli]
MSFKKVSAILRGNWLIDKGWAQSHMPLVHSFLQGNAQAGALIMGSSENDDEEEDDSPELVPSTVNVYEVCPRTKVAEIPFGAIANVDIVGPMMKDGDWCSWGMCDYAILMDALREAPNVAAVIIDIDSPGGQVDGTATLGDAIRNCTTVKPVVGFIDDGMSASAAYWCISQCTEVYVGQPTDEVGSIGVYCTIADWNAYYASLGLPVTDVYSTLSEDKNATYKEAIKGNEAPLQEKLDFIANAFIDAVKQGRAGKIKGTDWATGKMYYAQDALALGLIDGVKNYTQLVQRTNSLIKIYQFKSIPMAFNKMLEIAQAESFAVTDEGFAMSEENLNRIEAALTTAETNAAAVTALTAANQQLTADVEANGGQLIKATEDLAAANTLNVQLQEEIATLKQAAIVSGTTIATLTGKVEALEKGDGKKGFTGADSEKDDIDTEDVEDASSMAFQRELFSKV